MQLSACIEVLFTEGDAPFEERVRRAAEAGLPAVEFWTWRDKNLEAVAGALEETGLALTSFVSEPDARRLVDPSTHEAFLAGFEESTRAAVSLGCQSLIVVAGEEMPGVSRELQHTAVVEALRAAAHFAEEAGVNLLLEPLNSRVDHPGEFLDGTEEGLDIVDEVGSPAVGLLYDLYHSVAMGEDPKTVLAGRVDRVGHLHVADSPGRQEPGTGTIDFSSHLGWIVANGYAGRVGLEYLPSVGSAESVEHIAVIAAALPEHVGGGSVQENLTT